MYLYVYINTHTHISMKRICKQIRNSTNPMAGFKIAKTAMIRKILRPPVVGGMRPPPQKDPSISSLGPVNVLVYLEKVSLQMQLS